MRFGMLHYSYGSVDEVVNLAKLAEEKNFESYWIPEVGLPRDLYVVLTHMFSHTKRIVMGPETNPYTRHPAITANALATLDEVSGGRAALMIGSGHRGYLFQVGIQHHPQAVDVMKEAIQICRGVWSGKRFNYDGVRFKIRNLKIGYEFRKDIPIILADNDSEILKLAGPYADGICTNLTPLEYLPELWGCAKEGLAKSGRETPDFRFYFQPLIAIAKDRDEARKTVERIIFHSLSLVYSHDPLRESIGLKKEDLTPALEASMKEMMKAAGDLEFATVKCASIILKILKREVADRLLDKTTIYGTVEDVIERLKEYEKAGVQDVLIGLVLYPNPFETDVSDYIKLIGEEIIPHFGQS
jgi:5,10-methylenetetrahydromethanopterin reductase